MNDEGAGSRQFEEEVFPEELEAIGRRRRAAAAEPVPDLGKTPSTGLGLVGLAFSGGGIRSASFNLGVVQGLHRHGVFQHADYMSGVSGGAFLAGAIAAHMSRPPREAEPSPAGDGRFPFAVQPGAGESEANGWFRDHVNYLEPSRAQDYLRFMGAMVRSIVFRYMATLPWVLVACLLAFLSLRMAPGVTDGASMDGSGSLFPWTSRILVAAVAYYLLASALSWLSQLLLRRGSGGWGRRLHEWILTSLVWLSLLAVFLDLHGPLIRGFHQLGESDILWGWDRGLFLGMLFAALAVLVFTLAFVLTETILASRLVVVLMVTLLSFPMVLVYLFVLEALIWEAGPVAVLFALSPAADLGLFVALLVAVGLLLVFSQLIMDVNEESLHNAFRERIARAFLNPSRLRDGTVPEIPVSSLAGDDAMGPYPILNTAVTLPGSTNPAVRRGNGDIFVFTPMHAGSEATGYYRTRELEAVYPQASLSGVLAAAASSFSDQVSRLAVGPLRYLVPALSRSGGMWIPNPWWFRRRLPRGLPAAARIASSLRRLLVARLGLPWRPSASLQIRRSLGALHERVGGVCLLDGGHVENLGVWELLRRRCREILVGDAEADPLMAFHGLAHVMREARNQLGIEIDIDLMPLYAREDGLSQEHCAVGVIRYPETDSQPPEAGRLLYMKASVTGDESEVIMEYRRRHPNFPQESTADSWFSDDQFDAYRSLGWHVVESVYGPDDPGEVDGARRLDGLWERHAERQTEW